MTHTKGKIMKKIAHYIAAATIAACSATNAMAADITLKISSWVPPKHGVNTEIFGGLIKMIEEATDGKVTGELVFGLAPPPAQMDLIMDGAADMTIIVPGYQPGRFTSTKLVELPGYEGNAEASSVAFWRVYKAHLEKLNEFRGVKVISLNTHGPGQIHSSKEINSLGDLKNLKTRIGGGVAGDVGAALGLIGVNVPAPKVYETLASGAADAVTMNVGERVGFKLNEVAKNLYEMPGGLYRSAFAIIMNEEKLASLPADIQRALEDKVFGEPASRMAGAAWDKSDKIAYEASRATDDVKIIPASKKDQKAFNAITQQVIDKVLAEVKAKGVDVDAAYGMMRMEMAKN